MRNHPQTRGWRIEDRGWKSIPRVAVFAIIYHLSAIISTATLVQFPLAQMFAVTNYAKPFTLTAQLPEITDGTNIYVGTYTIFTPTGGTNPIVQLTPNNYLLSFTDSKLALRFSVPNSAATLNLLNLITNGLAAFPNWSPAGSFALGTTVAGSSSEAAVWMLGMAADGTAVSNAVPVSGSSTSSNNFIGSLNAGQVYGLGTVAALNSNTVIGMAGAAIAGSNYLTTGVLAASNSYNGTFAGNGAALSNLPPGPVVASGNGNVTVTPTTNATTGQVTYSVASTGGISSASSNSFIGQLNAGQVYGLATGAYTTVGNAATLASNQIVNMATNQLASGAYLTPGSVATLSSNQMIGMALASVAGGSATNAIALNGGTGTNITLTQATSVDQLPELYATPTWGIFYGDSITQGNYVTNGYCADLGLMGFRRFTVADYGISSSHLYDVSNLFWGSSYSGSRSYTNYPKAGTNVWVSFWIGINDCLYGDGVTPFDTNTWIASYTNMWWTAHTNGANPVVVFTIEDSLQLSAGGETNRALLNSLITENALADNGWLVLMNNDLILPSTNATYFLYSPAASYGLHPNDYGHSLVAQALASQLVLGTNLARGAYFAGPVWSATGFGGNGSNLLNVPVTLGNAALGTNTTAAVGMLGIDGSGRVTSNAVPSSSGSTSSNNFVGSLNVGQVNGLGTVATLSSNAVIGMAGAAIAGSNYLSNPAWSPETNNNGSLTLGTIGGNVGLLQLADGTALSWDTIAGGNNGFAVTGNLELGFGYSYFGNGANLTNTPGPITIAGANVTVTASTNAATGRLTYAVAASGGGGSTSSTLTNATLAKITSVDQHPVLYATPTWGILYGDTITQGNYVTNDYAADLLNLGWQHFMVTNCGVSSSHLTDVSNNFFGSGYGGSLCYTNWVGTPGTNAWVSFWIGVNDCNTWPLDTNTWINSFTNMWWTAHTNGANVVVFTIADSTQLSSGGETNRAILNSLITQNATGDNAWLVLLNNDLILPGTNSAYYLYNATAGYGVFPNDRGHSLAAQALASQLLLQTNLARGAYYNGPVWSATGFGGSGSNLFNLPAAKVVGVLAATNVPVNTVVNVGSGLTVASNSVGGVQTYTVGVGSIAAASPFLSQRVWAYMPTGSGTTVSGFGQASSLSGTLSSFAETATDPYAVVLSTTTTAGNSSTLGDNQKTITAAKPLLLVWRAGLTNTANLRVWMAVSDYATIAAGDVSRNAMGFLYTSTNNADWKLVTQNSGVWQWTDTGIAADTNTHTFEVSYDGSANVYGYIDNICVATNTANLITGFPYGQWLTVTSLTTNTVGVRFLQFYGQQGF